MTTWNPDPGARHRDDARRRSSARRDDSTDAAHEAPQGRFEDVRRMQRAIGNRATVHILESPKGLRRHQWLAAVQRTGGDEDDVVVDDVPGGAVFVRLMGEWKGATDNTIQDWIADERASRAEWAAFSSAVISGLVTVAGLGLTGPAAAGLAVGGAVVAALRSVPDEDDPLPSFREAMYDVYENTYDDRMSKGPQIINDALEGMDISTSGQRARRIADRCFTSAEGTGQGETPTIDERAVRTRVANRLDHMWRESTRTIVVGLPTPPRGATGPDVIMRLDRVNRRLDALARALDRRSALSPAEFQRARRYLQGVARSHDVQGLPRTMRADVHRRIRDLLDRAQRMLGSPETAVSRAMATPLGRRLEVTDDSR